MSEKCSKHNIDLEIDTCDCRICDGEGYVENDDYGFSEWVPCWNCNGTGESWFPVCFKCDEEYEDELEQELVNEQNE